MIRSDENQRDLAILRRDIVAPLPVGEIDRLRRQTAPNGALAVGVFAVAGRAVQEEELRSGVDCFRRAKHRARHRHVAVFLGQLAALTTPQYDEQRHQPREDLAPSSVYAPPSRHNPAQVTPYPADFSEYAAESEARD